MTRIIGLVVLIAAGFVAYNYFLGEGEDRERSEKIVNEMKDLGGAVAEMFENEKEKFKRGDYDKVLDKVTDFVDSFKSDENLDAKESKKLENIEKQVKRLHKKLDNVAEDDVESIQKIEKEIKNLVKKANQLVDQMEKE